MEVVLTKKKVLEAKPFLKWAGGKGQLISTIKSSYPKELFTGKIKKYIEPFIGGGAVLFDIVQNFEIDEIVISDINKDLINTYLAVKEDVHQVVSVLSEMEAKYISCNVDERKNEYYKIRENFNKCNTFKGENNVVKAAQFIFLNRTCFNGLYRVNRSGVFNVPSGDYSNPTICDSDNLYAVSKMLKNVQILCCDFKCLPWNVDCETFVYFDPPYRPLNVTSSFTSYNEQNFDDKDQKELSEVYKKLHLKGAFLMLSNSDPKNTNVEDDFFDNIYQGFNIRRVLAKRAINSKGGNRGTINEILVTNYYE